VATANDDHVVTLWGVTNRNRPVGLAALRQNGLQTESVVFSPDGRTLAAGGDYYPPGKVTLWDYTPLNELRANPAKYACDITGRGLTSEEWDQYIPELPYQQTCPG
jgi:hypothetical protein